MRAVPIASEASVSSTISTSHLRVHIRGLTTRWHHARAAVPQGTASSSLQPISLCSSSPREACLLLHGVVTKLALLQVKILSHRHPKQLAGPFNALGALSDTPVSRQQARLVVLPALCNFAVAGHRRTLHPHPAATGKMRRHP